MAETGRKSPAVTNQYYRFPYLSGLPSVVSAVSAACSAVSSVVIRISTMRARSPRATASSQAAIWPEITSLSLTDIPA